MALNRRIVFALTGFYLAITGLCYGQTYSTLTGFYQSADTVAMFPADDRKLEVLCQKQIGQYFCTFIGYEHESHPFIAAVTPNPIHDPNTEISRSVEFKEILPTAGKVTTWGYIFDRNGDGKIDYMALLEGAAAVEPPKFPKSFPPRGKRMQPKEMEYFVNHCGLIFSHWADDNFDGRFDAAVIPDLDPKRDWVQRMLVFRCTHFDDRIDDAWGFRNTIRAKKEKVTVRKGTAAYRTLSDTVEKFSVKDFDTKSGILQIINNAAAACGYGSGSFPDRNFIR